MSTSSSQSLIYHNPSNTHDDEIDLRQVLGSLGRHGRLIALITGTSLIIGGIYAFTRKPLWEGQFQIVLETKNSDSNGRISNLLSKNAVLSSFAGLGGGGKSQLKTEIKILESPSVLKPTYNFVKSLKANAGYNVKNWTFQNWRNSNLNIKLEKDTSVLTIAYRDTDQNLILPVIRKISSDYQLYSGRDRSKSISNGLTFTEEQVKRLRQKAAKSSRDLDAFSIRYGIANSGEVGLGSSDFDITEIVDSSSGINLRSQLSSIHSTIKQKGDALSKLAAVNQELIRRQKKFTIQDPGVLALIRERDVLRRYIEVTAGGILTLPGAQPTSKEQAQELLLQFKELSRKPVTCQHSIFGKISYVTAAGESTPNGSMGADIDPHSD